MQHTHPYASSGQILNLMRAKVDCRQIQDGLKPKSTGLDRKDTWGPGQRTEGKNGSSLELSLCPLQVSSSWGAESQRRGSAPLALRNSWQRKWSSVSDSPRASSPREGHWRLGGRGVGGDSQDSGKGLRKNFCCISDQTQQSHGQPMGPLDSWWATSRKN